MTMELRQLTTFTAVAEEGSFTRAASRLHVVQSAVSASVRALERELGVTLFDRSTHRVELSAAGRALLPEARRTLAAATAARDAVGDFNGGVAGTVRLGAMLAQPGPVISVPRLLAELRATHPGVEVELEVGSSMVHAEALRRGRLDLAFLALPRWAAPGLDMTTLGEVEMLLAVPPAHRLAGRESVTYEQLAGERFVDGPPDWGSRVTIDRAFAAADVGRIVVHEVPDMAALVEYVHYGLGVAIVTRALVDARHDVELIPIRPEPPVCPTSLASGAGRELSAAAKAVVALARRSVR